jgi:SAM-dependent methyltransferase
MHEVVEARSSASVGAADSARWDALLASPRDGKGLVQSADQYIASDGGCYPIHHGIPLLFEPDEGVVGDVTETVRAFYEETPFPNYDDLDSRDSLSRKARKGVFASALDESIGQGATILEAGCGTGQLSNFLGMRWGRTVIGADLCLNSLLLADQFRTRFLIRGTRFLQMNLFRPPFKDDIFDVIVCNGVLHHTADPEGGFRRLVNKLKPGGYIIVGLYNWLGRLPTHWRGAAIRIFGDKMATLDRRLGRADLNDNRWQAWFRDQYMHPHESTHGYSEVIDWFDSAGLDYVSSIPRIDGSVVATDENLFDKRSRANRFDRALTELAMLMQGGRDGGLFIMIGRKSE